MKHLRLLWVLAGIACGVAAQSPAVSVKNLMTAGEFESAGLHKLTKDELAALDQWIVKVVTTALQRSSDATAPISLPGSYPIEASSNDETFIINGNVFKAKTYCFNVNKGDRVKFVDGSANGACASAKFLNVRTGRICDVWCE